MKSRVFATEYYRLRDMEKHINEWLDIMKGEQDQWMKTSEIYHSLKRMMGDEI